MAPENISNQFGRATRPLFALAEDIAHLNHGSYGATPREILEDQRRWQDAMEREPSGFMQSTLPGLLRGAATALGGYVNADPQQIALVENATQGANAVLASLALEPGDEILITDQTYGAVRNAAAHVCRRAGARLVTVSLPFPDPDEDSMARAFANGLSERTRLAIIDHVTSPTALVVPVGKLAALARQAGALVLIDGAHAPGMVPLDLADLDCDFYTGNCHKWLCSPKGCGFLWTTPRHAGNVHPTVISHGYGQGYTAEFDWTGTRDATAQVVLPQALAFRDRFGDAAIVEHNHALVIAAATMLADSWNTRVGAGEDFFGSMAMVELPIAGPVSQRQAHAVRARLLAEFKVQVPVNALRGRLWVRLSAQIYNDIEDYRRLERAVAAIAA